MQRLMSAASETVIPVDGLGLSGSAVITDNWIVFTDYKTIDAEANGANADLEFLSAGAGAFKRVTDTTDIYTTISVERLDISGSATALSVSDDDIGYGIGIGVRSMLTPLLEVGAKIDYVDIDDTDVFRAQANAFYHFTKNLSAGIGYETYRPSDVDFRHRCRERVFPIYILTSKLKTVWRFLLASKGATRFGNGWWE